MTTRFGISTYICAAVAVLLQVILASALTIGYAVPNFCLAFAIALAWARTDKAYVVLPFVVGLAFDFLSTQTLGAMALVCVLACYLISRAASALSGLTFPMICIFCFCGAFLAEAVYGLLLIIGGSDISFLQALLLRALPCAIYDGVLSVLFGFVLRKLAAGAAAKDEMNFVS